MKVKLTAIDARYEAELKKKMAAQYQKGYHAGYMRRREESDSKAARPQLPQDVEEFIADKQDYVDNEYGEGAHVIYPNDLRSWMSGHVRVPVELLYEIQQSIGTVDERSPQQVAGMFRAISVQIESVLNAGKGE